MLKVVFQSTPPRGGRLNGRAVQRICEKFQSTPPRGGRRTSRAISGCCINFNPRPRVGGDEYCIGDVVTEMISIHAPAWGATFACPLHCLIAGFQSTPPRGGRPPGCKSARHCWNFNPRPRVGGDSPVLTALSLFSHFNPRPRVGGDCFLASSAPDQRISIHAPAWGATLSAEIQRLARSISIHAPAWGATEPFPKTP